MATPAKELPREETFTEEDYSNPRWQADPRISRIGRIHRMLEKIDRKEAIKTLRCVCTLLDINVHFEGD